MKNMNAKFHWHYISVWSIVLFLSYIVLCLCDCVYVCLHICFRRTSLVLFLHVFMYVMLFNLGPRGRLITPNELPSLNKELTYLLTLLISIILINIHCRRLVPTSLHIKFG